MYLILILFLFFVYVSAYAYSHVLLGARPCNMKGTWFNIKGSNFKNRPIPMKGRALHLIMIVHDY